jgi:hypothetical protein
MGKSCDLAIAVAAKVVVRLRQRWPTFVQINSVEAIIKLNGFRLIRLPCFKSRKECISRFLEIEYKFPWNYTQGTFTTAAL